MFIRRESFSQYIRLYPIVTFLLAANIIIFILTMLPFIGPAIYGAGMGVNAYIAAGEWWRFFTPMFLHAGFMHLLFNMFFLFVFGPELEKLAGKTRFLTIYLLSGIFGNVAVFFLKDLGYAHVGASGAIYGILGAFGALVYYTKKMLPELRQVILPIIAIGVVMTFLQDNINVTAHIVGLIVGFLIGLSYFHPKNIASWKRKKVR
ncbi:rhomboid family intramembrane serine protease [Sporosarcina siberiensis]|uniref:Rhomboid family intramembrane serine protease n=1 Tax=Sporosarcina siberiensis TaxID=1365606 RepID=A0ABW4SEA1_9BACL